MIDDYSDGFAFDPWLPTYAKVIHDRPDLGWNGLEIDPEKYPKLTAAKSELGVRFFQRYADRMINQETLPRWQIRLQNRFDEIASRYERAFAIYEKYSADMIDDVKLGTEQVGSRAEEVTSSESGDLRDGTREIDTPDAAINRDKDYADRVTDKRIQDQRDSSVGTEGSHRTEFRVKGKFIEAVNTAIFDYRDLPTELVAEFENNFLNIFWS